jgi:hypothetical protein
MRPLPVLTALLVVAALYMALIERDALLRFVGLAANATTELFYDSNFRKTRRRFIMGAFLRLDH